MRSILVVWLTGGLLAVGVGNGCADLDSQGQGGRAGAASTAGDAAPDVSTNGGSSGSPAEEAGADAGDRDVTDSAAEFDAAAAIATCKAAANGAACTTCACDHCIEYISACNKDQRCRAVLDCAARTGCRGTTECWDACLDVILAAEDAVYYASKASNCRTEICATECAPNDADAADGQSPSPDAADVGSEGVSDARSEPEQDAGQE